MAKLSESVKEARSKAESVCKALKADAYIAYVTSSREPATGFGGAVNRDILPQLARQLKDMGKKNKLLLLIHTNGGDLFAPWPIVSLLREYCSELEVVVIDRALSAGTLISLAADKIVMNPNSFLSPIDPQAQLVMNGQVQNVEVEDVTGYIEFIKNRVGLSGGAGLEKAVEALTNQIPATAIGSLNRTYALIRSLASKMLNTRKEKLDTATEKQVIENLTEKLFSHNHLISRNEAKTQVGLADTIVFADGDISDKIYALSDELNKVLKMDKFFDPSSAEKKPGSPYEEEIKKVLLFTETNVSAFNSKVSIETSEGKGVIKVTDTGWEKG